MNIPTLLTTIPSLSPPNSDGCFTNSSTNSFNSFSDSTLPLNKTGTKGKSSK
jgi:hypothetical protein